MNHITSNELSYWLTLSQTPGVGIHTIKKLLKQFHCIEAICKASSKQLQNQQLNDEQIAAIKNPNQKEIDVAQQWLNDSSDHAIIPFTDSRYPTLLLETSCFPILLYIHGDMHVVSQPQIAMVGSRKPTHTGLELASEFARALSQRGLIITSGLALGIDAASHDGALNAGGKTIAILGSGLKQVYPRRNYSLAERIAHNGCLISELPLYAGPLPENFPRRNRIISGLSLGTLVIEAAPYSGSLITARFALEQNREVFAIPGSPRNPMAKGCLSLIQQGAKCVTCVEDIINEIGIFGLKTPVIDSRFNHFGHQNALDSIEQRVLACIEDVTTIDQICIRSKLSAQLVATILLQLELKDMVKYHHGSYELIRTT